MPRIFISYRRTDSSTVSGRIYDHLAEVFGDDNVFKDVYDIPAGSDFRQVIEDNINASNIQLIVIGPTWIDVKAADGTRRLDNTEDAVRIEVESGLNCRDILLIPVLVSGAPMPRPEQFPESMRDLSFRNAVTIRDDPDFRTDISNLIRAIKQRESQRAQGQFRRRLPIFATSAVLGIVVLLLIVYAATRQQMPQVSVIISTKTSVVQLASTLAPSLEAPTTTPLPASATALPASATTASGLTPDTPDAAKAVALIREGDALQQQNDYSSALDRYTQALVLDPTNAEAYISRASVYSLLGTNFDQAIQDANQAIQLDPNNYWNYDELGKIYSADEKYDLSVQAYSKALALQSVPSGYLGRGRAYHLLGDIPDALADLTHSIELDPTNLDVYVERAWTNYDAKTIRTPSLTLAL